MGEGNEPGSVGWCSEDMRVRKNIFVHYSVFGVVFMGIYYHYPNSLQNREQKNIITLVRKLILLII